MSLRDEIRQKINAIEQKYNDIKYDAKIEEFKKLLVENGVIIDERFKPAQRKDVKDLEVLWMYIVENMTAYRIGKIKSINASAIVERLKKYKVYEEKELGNQFKKMGD